jgi:hypothetical protein
MYENIYNCRECGIDVPAPTYKNNDGFCNDHRTAHSMIGLYKKSPSNASPQTLGDV